MLNPQIGCPLPLVPLTLLSLVLFGCAGEVKLPIKPSQFEIDFYATLAQIDPKDSLTDLDLGALTPFAWDSVLIVMGDDEGALDAAFISSYLHRPTEGLPEDGDRFYSTKNGIVVETTTIEKANGWGKPSWLVVPYLSQPVNCAVCDFYWLNRSECRFKAQRDQGSGYGTYFTLWANCPGEKAQ